MDHTARDAAIADAYKAGASLRATARDFDLSYERVRQILKAQGVPLRGRSQANRMTHQQRVGD